jgi:hypothetical protein
MNKIYQNGIFKEVLFVKCYIHQNFPFALQSRVNPHFHSQQSERATRNGESKNASQLISNKRSMGNSADIHNEVLPLTLQSEIKQHQIISLIKGNC